MGHSMGAQTALTFAAGHPDRVRAAILEDPPLRLNETAEVSEKEREAHYQEWRQRVEDYKTQSEDELMAMCRERSPEWSAADLPAWALSKRQVSADVLKIVQRPRSNWRQEMRGLRCPTLLITGDPDRGAIVTPEIADEAAALADDLVVVRVKGAGHNIRREGFEQYIAAVEGFLAGLED
jgi:pimeloyl-ACP methyl ester carboxylesterase